MTPEELAMTDVSLGKDLPQRTAVATEGWNRGAPYQDEAAVDEALVYAKLAERENARRAKDFDLADDIMDELTNHGVAYLDDRDKTWYAFAPPVAGSAGDVSGGPFENGGNNLGKRAGDWVCPECGANVFASKSACYRCSCPRPGGPGPTARQVGGAAGPTGEGKASGHGRQRSGDYQDGRAGYAGPYHSLRFPPFVREQGDGAEVDEAEVEALIEQREAARKDRDYFTADGIRDMLQVAHVLLPSAGSLPSLSSCLPPFSPVRHGPCAIDTLWRGLRCMSPKT